MLEKMRFNYPGIKLEPALGTLADKIGHLSSYAHVVHTTAKQVISRRRKNDNVFKTCKDERCTCKACKNTVFHCQICKFVGFLLPPSPWLLKIPNRELTQPRRQQERHKCAYLIVKNNSLARFARAVLQLCRRRDHMMTNVQFCLLICEALAPI